MAVFSDNFNRADGALGGNWSVSLGSMTIVGGKASGTGTSYAVNTTVSDANRLRCTTHVFRTDPTTYKGGPLVKMASSGSAMYGAFVSLTTGVYSLNIEYHSGSALSTLVSVELGAYIPPYYSLSLEWDYGTLTAIFNGTTTLTTDHSILAGNTYAGIQGRAGGLLVDDVFMESGDEIDFSADPNVIGNYGDCTEIELTGANTSWTSGTPGSPTFTVNHGTISAQTVNSATSATITYCPGDYLGAVTITDPSTGMTVGIVVTSDPEVVPPGSACLLDEAGADIVNDTGANYPNYDLLTQGQVIVPAADQFPAIDIVKAISDTWYIVTGGGGRTPPEGLDWLLGQLLGAMMGDETPTVQLYTAQRATSIREELEGVTDRLATLITPTEHDLDSVIASIKGLDNRSITQVYDLVDALTGGDNSDVLLWLNTYLGTTGPTLDQLGTLISDLATIAGYDLGDVLDAIAAIPPTDLSGVMTKLSEIQPNATYTLSSIAGQLDGVAASLGTINDKLDALEAAVAAIPTDPVTGGPPVWPGVGDATLGSPVALTAQLALDGPMHGVLVNVTVPPTNSGRISLGGQTFDYKSGEIAFVSDNGFIEPWQYIGWRQGLYTPKCMSQASSALFRILSGCEGTARTFIRS